MPNTDIFSDNFNKPKGLHVINGGSSYVPLMVLTGNQAFLYLDSINETKKESLSYYNIYSFKDFTGKHTDLRVAIKSALDNNLYVDVCFKTTFSYKDDTNENVNIFNGHAFSVKDITEQNIIIINPHSKERLSSRGEKREAKVPLDLFFENLGKISTQASPRTIH